MLNRCYAYVSDDVGYLIASRPTRQIAICLVKNGVVAVGDLASIKFDAYRCDKDAIRFAKEIVQAIGGVAVMRSAWLTMAVPSGRATSVWEHAARVFREELSEDDMKDVPASLWRQGRYQLVDINSVGGVKFWQSSHWNISPLECVPGWRDVTLDDGTTDRWPALWFRMHRTGDPMCVTDRGRPVAARLMTVGDDRSDCEVTYTSPEREIAHLTVSGPLVDDALRVLGISPFIRNIYKEFDRPVVPEGIEWVIGGDDSTEYVHIDTAAARLSDDQVEKLEPLAYAVNFHADLPEWAGWQPVVREKEPQSS